MEKQNAGDASNSKGTVKMDVPQKLMKEEAEVKEQLEAAKCHGEEQKARVETWEEKLARMLNNDFEGIPYEDVKLYYDKLVEIEHEINDLLK